MTALSANSKADTVFLCLPAGGGVNAMAVDVSQYRTDLSVVNDTAVFVFESDSIRTAITYPREISLVIDLDNNDLGTLIKHGENALNTNYTYRITYNGGTVTCLENGNTRVSATAPGVGGGTETFVIHWSSRADGASVRHELYMRNLDDGSEVYAQATTAAGTTNNAWEFFINGDDFDTGLPDLTVYQAVRVSKRFHSTTEAREDWVAQTTPPAITARRRAPVLTFETSDLDVAQDDYPAGPTYAGALHHARESDMRMLGPLVNVRPRNPMPERNNYLPAAYYRYAPKTTDYHFCLRHLWHVKVPPKCNRVRARIHVQVYSAGSDTCTLWFRLYSMAPAGAPLIPLSPFEWYASPAVDLLADHGDPGLGEWVDLGECKIATKKDEPHTEYTVFALGFSFNFDAGDPEEDDTFFKIKSVVIEPAFVESVDGYDLAQPEESG